MLLRTRIKAHLDGSFGRQMLRDAEADVTRTSLRALHERVIALEKKLDALSEGVGVEIKYRDAGYVAEIKQED